jgi:PQQ-dependent dehydrogenase (methanol/ethanol family)
MINSKRYSPVFLAALLCAWPVTGQDNLAGRRLFAARCASCHGADGGGGEFGPDIADVRGLSHRNANLAEFIKSGNPDGGMPAFPLPQQDIDALAALVAGLRAPAIDHPPAGNPEAGERFFAGKGNCSNCHMVKGRGGILGPDLSNLGRDTRLARIEQALHDPSKLGINGYKLVSVHLRSGETLRGLAKNESNYDLQLQDLTGKFHLLQRTEITQETADPKGLMPPLSATADEQRDLLAYLSRLSREGAATSGTGTAPTSGAPAFSAIANPKPGEWPTYNGHLSGNRHSDLTGINTGNVAQLGAKWMFPIPGSNHLEGTPVVVDGVMYVTAANQAFALDARSGREIWHYSRPLTKGVIGDAGTAINRGVAVLGDAVFMVTDNAHIIALNRQSGELLWDSEMADYRKNYGSTSAPLVVKDLVIAGTSGGDEGARGSVDAYKTSTGEHAWRFWNMPAPGEPLSETWVGRVMESQHGCVDSWLTGTYDPGTNLIYWPTGNPCPDYNGDERKGDNLYSTSVLAIEPETGKLKWHFQFSPHDLHDWDATETTMLIDEEFHGRPRKLLVQANRNGFFYVLDRVTGEFLLGEPFVKEITWASGIGPDGRPKLIPGQEPTEAGTRTCPAVAGATNWMSTAYNPVTKLFYVMALESCNIYTKSSEWWQAGQSFYGGAARRVPGEVSQKFVRALDIQTGKIVWEVPLVGAGRTGSGVLSTAGGVLFFGDDTGAFSAIDAKDGKPLWRFNTNDVFRASPMTYMVDGKQYLAIASGSHILAFGLPQ